jgi:branched-chain amino acid transport system ATP-binding protein
MLFIKNLKSGYNNLEILHGIDFEVKSAEIVALIGPNGAGKSTLLKSIFNLCQIFSGSIFFNNKELTGLPTYQLINLGISYVPQGRQIFPSLTTRENLEMAAFALEQKSKTNFKSQIQNLKQTNFNLKNILEEKIYNFFPILKEKEKELASNLSGGEQQMLVIARALIQQPKLLLLDEPSLGLAPKVMKEVFEKIEEINRQGVGIIIVEQNARQAVKIANRTYILEDGKIALEGGKEILENPQIKNIYFGGR